MLGRRLHRQDLPDAGTRYCEATLPERSIYRLLHDHRERLFPDALFADLFQPTGRRSVPPSILAVVMVLQRLEGLSDREAADRFVFDVRWRYAAGVGDLARRPRALRPPCWWICAPGCAPRELRIGSSG